MKLRNKFLFFIGLIIICSYGSAFFLTSQFQHKLVYSLMVRQARLLSEQIVLTRKWVADHNGIFIVKKEGVAANPFLQDSEFEIEGKKFVKRNPAMVTRELSEYSQQMHYWRFRVTSLNPVNPDNTPNDFEKKSLEEFADNKSTEAYEVAKNVDGLFWRYITPLLVEESCLECHAQHGYKIGDVRGGLSLEIPMDWEDQAIAGNRGMLLAIFAASMLVIAFFIGIFIEIIVIRRLDILSRAMDRYPEEKTDDKKLPTGRDEIGKLSNKFKDLGTRLAASQREVERTNEQMLQVEKLAALGRLSAGIAHEINNPLGGMLNCIKSMEERPADENMRVRYLDLIKKGLQRIENTVRQLLNFGPREPLELRKVNVDELISECLAILDYRLKNMTIKTELNLSAPLAVDVDAMKQVVINLGLNAIQAMDDGGSLTVKSKASEKSIIITVTDTGEGISEEVLPHIFDPFFTTKEVGEGTGLGLAVTYSLVQRMGGTVEVDSTPGTGSSFIITIPKQEI